MNTKHFFMIFAVVMVITLAVPQVRAAGMDALLQAAVKESYTFKTYLKDDNVTVQSVDGVVTLTGTVADESHKAMAQDTVESLPDVKGVVNQLQVTPQSPPENSDAWLSVKVKTALLFRRNVSVIATKVYVKDGLVTLEGEADSEAQKELTALYANDVEGVKGVINKIVIVEKKNPPAETLKEKIDDASVTAQVKMTLLLNRSTSALKTKVETDNGVVTLTGTAKNAAEKDLVTKLVGDINGVDSVVNNMDVAK